VAPYPAFAVCLPGCPGHAARHDLHQSTAAVAAGDPFMRVRESCTWAAADPAVFLPFLLDPASACAPRSRLLPTFVRVASQFLRAAGDALVVVPLAASCVQGQFPNPLRQSTYSQPMKACTPRRAPRCATSFAAAETSTPGRKFPAQRSTPCQRCNSTRSATRQTKHTRECR
jgi:hypothetical protein